MNTPPRLSDPVVLVASSAPRLQMLLVNLKAANFRAIDLAGSSTEDRSTAELVLYDTMCGAFPSQVSRVANTLTAVFTKPGTDKTTDGADFHVDSLSKFSWLRSQVLMRRRNSLRESETQLRGETAEAFGRSEAITAISDHQHVLIAASPGPRWLAVTKALQANGVRVSACLTPETLRMRMQEEPVSLVLAERGPGSSFVNAAALAAANDPRAEAIPVAVWPMEGHENTKGLGPQVDWTFPADEAPNTVALKCRVIARSGETAPIGTQSETHDSLTGLPSRIFFENHLDRQIAVTRRTSQPMALAAFRLQSGQHESRVTDLAIAIQKNLRAEDMAARLDWQTIVVSLRATDFQDAHAVTERLMHCLSHEGLPGGSIQPRVVELRQGQDATSFIDAALGKRELTRPFKVAI